MSKNLEQKVLREKLNEWKIKGLEYISLNKSFFLSFFLIFSKESNSKVKQIMICDVQKTVALDSYVYIIKF